MIREPDVPFADAVYGANQKIKKGFDVYQKWWCEYCGARQTMPTRNHFYAQGICEECGRTTNIVANGCNYMACISTNMDELRQIVDSAMRGDDEE